jgi:hypothetical protein
MRRESEMRYRISFTLVLIGVGALLGSTVLRDGIANAAQSVGATITGPLDSSGDVAVHEQGTANVSVTNTSLPVSGTVAVAATTRELLDTPTGGVGVQAGFGAGIGSVDVSPFSQVRVAADQRGGANCNNVVLHIDLEGTAGPGYRLFDADLCQGDVNTVFVIPGTKLDLFVTDNGDFNDAVDVTVWGR